MKRIAWIVLMLALAIVATGAELDRASRRQPTLAALVPPPFRSFAQEQLTIATVRRDRPEKALDAARTLVRRRPMPAEHLSLLAIAMERAGDRRGSALLVQSAARRGWRDSIAQQAMFDISLGAGDPVEASHRLAAINALGDDQAPTADFTRRLLATSGGREAMARTLVDGGNWRKAFVAMPATPDLAATLALSIRHGARFDCSQVPAIEGTLGAYPGPDTPTQIGQARADCIRKKR